MCLDYTNIHKETKDPSSNGIGVPRTSLNTYNTTATRMWRIEKHGIPTLDYIIT